MGQFDEFINIIMYTIENKNPDLREQVEYIFLYYLIIFDKQGLNFLDNLFSDDVEMAEKFLNPDRLLILIKIIDNEDTVKKDFLIRI